MSLTGHIRKALEQGNDPGTFALYDELKNHFPDASPNWLRNEITNIRTRVRKEMAEASSIMKADQ
jgi:hypothetical protein